MLILPMPLGVFHPPKPASRIALGLEMMTMHEKIARDHQVRTAANPVLGLGGRKAPSSIGKTSPAGVLRLRASSAVSRGKAVRRSAQDDDFVGVLRKTSGTR